MSEPRCFDCWHEACRPAECECSCHHIPPARDKCVYCAHGYHGLCNQARSHAGLPHNCDCWDPTFHPLRDANAR